MSSWRIAEAKSRFSELLRRAAEDGPQVITNRGEEAAVVISAEEYHCLKARQPDFKAYLLSGPKVDDFDIDRPADEGRDVEW